MPRVAVPQRRNLLWGRLRSRRRCLEVPSAIARTRRRGFAGRDGAEFLAGERELDGTIAELRTYSAAV